MQTSSHKTLLVNHNFKKQLLGKAIGNYRHFRIGIIFAGLLSVILVLVNLSPSSAYAAVCTPPALTFGTETMNVSVPGISTYTLWLRMKLSASSNSLLLQVDSTTCYSVTATPSTPQNTWVWINYSNQNAADVMQLPLSAGNHSLEVIGTNTGASLNTILLLADQSCVPSGDGSNCTTNQASGTVTATLPSTTSKPPGSNTASGNKTSKIKQQSTSDSASFSGAATATEQSSGGLVTLTPSYTARQTIKQVNYYLNNKLVYSSNKAPYSYTISTNRLLNGQYVLVTRILYISGQTSTSSTTLHVSHSWSREFILYILNYWGWLLVVLVVITGLVLGGLKRFHRITLWHLRLPRWLSWSKTPPSSDVTIRVAPQSLPLNIATTTSIVIPANSPFTPEKLRRTLHHPHLPDITGVAVVLLVAILGVNFMVFGHAASLYVDVNASSGTLTGDASLQSDTSATGGQYVQFGFESTSDLRSLKEFNYFPSLNSWPRMWSEFNSTEMNSNFATMHAMGANTVRIIIPANSSFGWPDPTSTMLSELSQTVSLAAANGLQVQLTLFDEFGLYTDTADSVTWANAVLDSYKNDPRIVFVEIQNEVNPSDSAAVAWLQNMIPVVKTDIGSIPVTASVTNTSGTETVAQTLALMIPLLKNTPLDFYDVHYYSNPGSAYSILSAVKSEAGTTPVYVGETGYTSWDGNQSTNVVTEDAQDVALRSVEYVTQELGLGTAAVWVFQDFPSGQGGITQTAGTYSAQNFFGLLRTDGSLKPAADSIESYFQTGTINTDINGDFSSDTDSNVTDWSIQNGSEGTFNWDSSVGHDAPGSVEISNSTIGPGSSPPNYHVVPIVNLTGTGQTVTATVWAESSNATGANDISIDWFDDTGTYISSNQSSWLTGTHGWTELTSTATAPSNAAYFQVSLGSTNNTGSVWFDDVNTSVN